MPPEDKSIQNVYRKPSMGSFSTTLVDELKDIISERKAAINSPDASLQTVEADTSGILEAEKELNSIVNRPMEKVFEKQTITTPPRNIGGEIKPPFDEMRRERSLKEMQTALEQLNTQVEKLRAEKLISQNNSNTSEDATKQPEIIHVPQSEESASSVGNLLPNFIDRKITQDTTVQPQIITSEMIHETPSELSQTRSKRLMPKTLAPRPRLINGKTEEVRMETLLKKETPPDDMIDVVLEKITDKIPSIDTVIEKVTNKTTSIDTQLERRQVFDYQKISDLVEKLMESIGDERNFILKIFSHFKEQNESVNQQKIMI